jgi:Tol biopolymer transport system component
MRLLAFIASESEILRLYCLTPAAFSFTVIWHPNGKSLVLTLSKQGNKDIYSYSLANKKLTRLTQHKGIDNS